MLDFPIPQELFGRHLITGTIKKSTTSSFARLLALTRLHTILYRITNFPTFLSNCTGSTFDHAPHLTRPGRKRVRGLILQSDCSAPGNRGDARQLFNHLPSDRSKPLNSSRQPYRLTAWNKIDGNHRNFDCGISRCDNIHCTLFLMQAIFCKFGHNASPLPFSASDTAHYLTAESQSLAPSSNGPYASQRKGTTHKSSLPLSLPCLYSANS